MLQEQSLMHKKRFSNENKTLLIQPVSQWSPVNPCRHLHLYPKASSMQVPSLWHGFSAQSKISVTIIKLITSFKWPQESPVVYHNSLANQKKRFNDAINQRHFKKNTASQAQTKESFCYLSALERNPLLENLPHYAQRWRWYISLVVGASIDAYYKFVPYHKKVLINKNYFDLRRSFFVDILLLTRLPLYEES